MRFDPFEPVGGANLKRPRVLSACYNEALNIAACRRFATCLTRILGPVVLELTSLSTHKELPDTSVANYKLTHSTPGARGTTLELNVQLEVRRPYGEIVATVTDLAPKVKGLDTEEALDKLADWLERSAKALRQRGAPRAMFSDYPSPLSDSEARTAGSGKGDSE